jgi:hypothetical protein
MVMGPIGTTWGDRLNAIERALGQLEIQVEALLNHVGLDAYLEIPPASNAGDDPEAHVEDRK